MPDAPARNTVDLSATGARADADRADARAAA
jgi:hypothetical protein